VIKLLMLVSIAGSLGLIFCLIVGGTISRRGEAPTPRIEQSRRWQVAALVSAGVGAAADVLNPGWNTAIDVVLVLLCAFIIRFTSQRLRLRRQTEWLRASQPARDYGMPWPDADDETGVSR
jgi:hypothetical protein